MEKLSQLQDSTTTPKKSLITYYCKENQIKNMVFIRLKKIIKIFEYNNFYSKI